jgi:hypothetical protein
VKTLKLILTMWKKLKIRIIKQKFIRGRLIMFMKKKTFQAQQIGLSLSENNNK